MPWSDRFDKGLVKRQWCVDAGHDPRAALAPMLDYDSTEMLHLNREPAAILSRLSETKGTGNSGGIGRSAVASPPADLHPVGDIELSELSTGAGR